MSQDVFNALRRLPLLQDLPDELLEELASVSRMATFPPGAVIFRQGDPARTIYFLVEGSASLELCAAGAGCKRILTVGPGELLGWSAVLEEDRLSATARAITQISAVEVDGPQAVAVCRHNPQLGYELMRRAAIALAKRLNATRMQLLDVYGGQMPQVPDERSAP
jgi:CRP/FNR family transcriptional regulator, cyclic AMP receptor protein